MLLERVNFSPFVLFFITIPICCFKQINILLFLSLQTALILADSPQLFICSMNIVHCPDKTFHVL